MFVVPKLECEIVIIVALNFGIFDPKL